MVSDNVNVGNATQNENADNVKQSNIEEVNASGEMPKDANTDEMAVEPSAVSDELKPFREAIKLMKEGFLKGFDVISGSKDELEKIFELILFCMSGMSRRPSNGICNEELENVLISSALHSFLGANWGYFFYDEDDQDNMIDNRLWLAYGGEVNHLKSDWDDYVNSFKKVAFKVNKRWKYTHESRLFENKFGLYDVATSFVNLDGVIKCETKTKVTVYPCLKGTVPFTGNDITSFGKYGLYLGEWLCDHFKSGGSSSN